MKTLVNSVLQKIRGSVNSISYRVVEKNGIKFVEMIGLEVEDDTSFLMA